MSDDRYVQGLEKADPIPPDPMPGNGAPDTVVTPKYPVAIRPRKRGLDLGGIVVFVGGVAAVLVEQTPVILDVIQDLGGSPGFYATAAKWLGWLAIAYAASSKMKQVLPVLVLLMLPAVAMAQQAAPFPKLAELQSANISTTVGSWRVATEAPLLVSGTDSARVYIGSDPASRVIIARIGVERWVYAGRFGWYRVTAVTLAEYNAIQQAQPTDWQYPNFTPLEFAFAVAVAQDGPQVLPPGAVMPRGIR